MLNEKILNGEMTCDIKISKNIARNKIKFTVSGKFV